MPLLRAHLSKAIDDATRAELLAKLSQMAATALGKPESYMMVMLRDEVPMLMAGSADPAAWVEVRSVGTINPEQAKKLSVAITEAITGVGIQPKRIYSNFQGVPGAMWGYGGDTFG